MLSIEFDRLTPLLLYDNAIKCRSLSILDSVVLTIQMTLKFRRSFVAAPAASRGTAIKIIDVPFSRMKSGKAPTCPRQGLLVLFFPRENCIQRFGKDYIDTF